MAESEPVVEFVHSHDIVERSDVDRDQKVTAKDLGDDDWGDGFTVSSEPVMVLRGEDGGIVKTVPLSEWDTMMERKQEEAEKAPPVEAPPVVSPTPLTTADREKLVEILAIRLFKWYASQPRNPTKYNPVYDGLPDAPPGSPVNLQPPAGTNLYPATPYQVLEWLKTTVIGPRAKIVNHKRGMSGYQPSLSFER